MGDGPEVLGAGLAASMTSMLMSRGGSFGPSHARRAVEPRERGRPVIAITLGLIGGAAVVIALAALRVIGTGYRIGRTLSAAPVVPLAELTGSIPGTTDASTTEAGTIAGATPDAPAPLPTGYLRTTGRIASEQEFPDDQDRPLVFRRVRLQARQGRGWKTLDDDRTAVPFGIEERGAHLAVDIDALGDGLVVVPRVADGVAADLPESMRPDGLTLASDAPVRVRIDQLSAVEHATVAGVLARAADGSPMLTAGAGRPLIVTSLAPDEAMRVLAGEDRSLVRLTAILLVAGLGALAAALVAFLLGW